MSTQSELRSVEPRPDPSEQPPAGVRPQLGQSASRAVVLGIRLASMAVNFLVQIVMAHVMGLAAFGIANTAIAILNIAVIPAALGYDTAAIRYTALASDDELRLRALTARIGRSVALGSLVTALLVGGAAIIVDALGSTEMAVGLAFLVVIVPGFAFIRVGEAWLRGVGSVVRAQINSNIVVPLLTILFLLAEALTASSSRSVDVAGALGARALATVISVVLVTRFVLTRLQGRLSPRAILDRETEIEMRHMAVVLCGVTFLMMAVTQIDIVAVAIFRGPSQAGIYSAASRVALAAGVAIVAVAFVLAPRVANLFDAREMPELQAEVSNAAFWSGVLMAGACVVIIPASSLVLRIFGAEFTAGSQALRILMVGQLANGLCGPVAVVLNMTGKQLLAIRALSVAAVVDVVMLVVLTPLLGLSGAACSTAACTIIWNAIMLFQVRRELKIWVLPRAIARLMP